MCLGTRVCLTQHLRQTQHPFQESNCRAWYITVCAYLYKVITSVWYASISAYLIRWGILHLHARILCKVQGLLRPCQTRFHTTIFSACVNTNYIGLYASYSYDNIQYMLHHADIQWTSHLSWPQGKCVHSNSKHWHLTSDHKTKPRQRHKQYTRCGRKVMRLATLCMNRQRCCHPLHIAVRLTHAVDSVHVWTCYAAFENVWSEVVIVRCVTKMDCQKFEQSCAIKFCVNLGESATLAYGQQSLSRAQV
jgi:hypothetical protein